MTEDHKESNESQSHDPILVEYEVDLSHVFKHPLSNIEDALEKLNFEAAKVNQYFKKGSNTINKYSAKYYYLRCSKYQTPLKDNSKKSKNFCKAYYSFTEITRTDSTGQKEILVELSKSIQTHNHHPLILNKLNEQMEEDIKFFSRRTKIVDIQKFLETKYGKTLNYQQIYFFFRKIHPLFGPKDCQFFINYLSKKKAFYRFVSDSNEQHLCKLYFATESMRKNYSNYHDVILLDATYSLNKYQIPVVIFSGIAADSTNIILGIALVNDETLETYNWVLKQFFESHGEIFPTVLVSDQDRAICSDVDKYKNHFDHFLCQWHLIRNLQRNFAFLKINHEEIYNSVLRLPYIHEKQKFDETREELVEFLRAKDFKKSVEYLERLFIIKEKWSDAYRKRIFTAGTHTTSRAESINAVIKRYMNRTCEISGLIYLLENVQGISCFQDFSTKNVQFKEKNIYTDSEPLLASLKLMVSQNIFQKHLSEFKVCSKYVTKLISRENDICFYDVYVIDSQEEEKKRKTQIGNNFIDCSCELYYTTGIICRHMFAIIKSRFYTDQILLEIKQFVHKRWDLTIEKPAAQLEVFSADDKKLFEETDKILEEEDKQEEKRSKSQKVFERPGKIKTNVGQKR